MKNQTFGMHRCDGIYMWALSSDPPTRFLLPALSTLGEDRWVDGVNLGYDTFCDIVANARKDYIEKRDNLFGDVIYKEAIKQHEFDGNYVWVNRIKGNLVCGMEQQPDGPYRYECRYEEGTGDKILMKKRDKIYLERQQRNREELLNKRDEPKVHESGFFGQTQTLSYDTLSENDRISKLEKDLADLTIKVEQNEEVLFDFIEKANEILDRLKNDQQITNEELKAFKRDVLKANNRKDRIAWLSRVGGVISNAGPGAVAVAAGMGCNVM